MFLIPVLSIFILFVVGAAMVLTATSFTLGIYSYLFSFLYLSGLNISQSGFFGKR